MRNNNIQNYEDEMGRAWQYRLELSGCKNVVFTIYSNDENLCFEQIWQSIISSDSRVTQAIPEFHLISIIIDENNCQMK